MKNKSGLDQKRALLPPARAIALETIRAVMGKGRDVQSVLDGNLKEARLSPQDTALATELVYGYLRSEIRLSWLIRRFLKADSKLPVELMQTLGLSVYEMLYLQRVPVYASVDWAVSYVRSRFGTGLSRLANAVLRNIDRLEGAPLRPEWYHDALADEADPRIAFLSIWYATPEWIVRIWVEAYGEERAEQYLTASSHSAPAGVRINMRHPEGPETHQRLAAHPECIGHSSSGLLFPAQKRPAELYVLMEEGIASSQSFAVQEVMDALQPETWEGPVWDCCCGRGGKTCALLERGVEVCAASDPSEKRLKGLRIELERLGLPDVPVFSGPASHVPEGIAPKAVLADVPCSGFGTLSRRPDIRQHRSQESVARLVAVQAEILDSTWSALPEAGLLAYITCTLNPEENEKQIEHFIERTGAKLELEWTTPPDSPASEFFYAALLRK
ncbi:transcription antitermination factor NusB [Oleidesulfovibrio sp.]|uniref:transcription antitermination factor NusB n=1 Tax=Oleidesulfovibrio sp. TaxID=2909707 RepID=UPI003A8C8320